MIGPRAFVATLFLLLLGAPSPAQDYPNRLIKLLHGFPAGGNVDVLARITAEEMSKGLGQPIIIEARPGAVGAIAAENVARAAPDGYTLLFLPSAHAVTGAINKAIKYDPVDDFAWISPVSFYPFVLVVKKDSPIRTLQELVEKARAKPDGMSYGSTGVGSIHHMTVELLANATKTKFVNITYRGEAIALTGLLSGDIDFSMATVTVAAPHLQSGAMRALGVTGKTRWRDLPDVPTFQEAGVPDYEVISWSGYTAPGGTPRPIIDRLNKEVHRALAVPAVKQRMQNIGGDVQGTTPEEMKALVARQVAMWAKLAKEANISGQ